MTDSEISTMHFRLVSHRKCTNKYTISCMRDCARHSVKDFPKNENMEISTPHRTGTTQVITKKLCKFYNISKSLVQTRPLGVIFARTCLQFTQYKMCKVCPQTNSTAKLSCLKPATIYTRTITVP